jgi:S-adenosylmethionine hydrolase
VPVGQPLVYVDSRGRISLAINQGNFAQLNKITVPGTVFIAKKGLPSKIK